MKRQTIHFIIICLILALILATGCITTRQLEPVSTAKLADMQSSLDEFIPTIEEQLNEIFILTNSTAGNLTGTTPDSQTLNQALLQLRRDIPAAYDVYVVSADNTFLAVISKQDKQNLIGKQAGISTSDADFTNTTNGCIITKPITFITGERGVLIIAPIYDENGTYIASLRVSLNPVYLFSGPVNELKMQEGYTVWSIQPDGVQIYDEDIEELDKNVLTDPLYSEPTISSAMHLIAEEKQGNVSYMFQNVGWTDYVQANAVWNTIDLPNGIEWRVVLSDNSNFDPNQNRRPTVDDLKAFVEKAYIYTQTHTKEEALRVFNDPNGEFIDGELYIFAYDMNGTTLALPYQQSLVGTNRWYGEDIVGVRPLQRFIDKAKFGGGFVYYQYPNPSDKFLPELKLSYVMSVDEDWLIGAGIYPGTMSLNYSWEDRNQLISQVRGLQYLSTTLQKEELLQMINDPNSTIQVDGLYPFALDPEGTVLGNAHNPSMTGKNRLGYTNSYDMSPVREIISLAESGGGLMYSLVWDADLKKEVYVLIYVEPADEETYYGSMMRLE
ncbi:Cache, type 2 domain protein [Methanocorpusculum labreanum Z]|uniref:Cache, type 2 domain protein n=1 Tax=Methanocorpusculum labreanum (strain ATCC 43576 / DSM 4855 / Z) TaxID=410358 RepID=A2SRC0_METLZ|nr:cache domain-containing protein [Methanocorpusculum labreanum]ABN06876.1 Cache, type 2 domain protein [Methanocorpusculum labreanum Z]